MPDVKRTASVRMPKVNLDVSPIKIRARRNGKYIGRIEISKAGLAAYDVNKKIANLTWEKLMERLRK
jgi:hypothetical protein